MATFAENITALRKKQNKKRQEVADDLGISRSSLEYYEKNKRKPDIEVLTKIADYYGVSADYLLGRTNAETTDKDLRFVCEYTGLSDEAAIVLHLWHTCGGDKRIISIVNLLLESEKSSTVKFLHYDNYDDYEKTFDSLPKLQRIKALYPIESFFALNPDNKQSRNIYISKSGKLISMSETYPEYADHLSFEDLLSIMEIKESEIIQKLLIDMIMDTLKELKKERDTNGNHHETQ